MSAWSLPVRLRRRSHRIIAVLLALILYLAIDGAILAAPSTVPQWDMRVDSRGIITWVDPNGPADTAGITAGDRLVRPAAARREGYDLLMQRSVLTVQRSRGVRMVQAAPFGPTRSGQALVLVGVLLLLVGGLVWAYGRQSRASGLLGALSASAAIALLSEVWGHDGYGWAMRAAFVAGSGLFPVCWAAFFLSFPHDRLAQARWRRPFVALLMLALIMVVAYVLCLSVGWPYTLVHALGAPVFPLGLLLGLGALAIPSPAEQGQTRQQRRLVALSAAGAILPILLGSFIPLILVGRPSIPFEVTTLAVVLLPLGLAYAVVRHDLMELDVVVRRIVALILGSCILVGVTVVAALALSPLFPRLDLSLLVIAVLGGAVGGRYTGRWATTLAERLLSPELVQSRRLLAALGPAILSGEEDLPGLAARLEEAARGVATASWARLLVRRRGPGSVFCAIEDGATPIDLPLLATASEQRPWGLGFDDRQGPLAPTEWAALCAALAAAPAALVPLRLRGEVIALLTVGEPAAERRIHGPEREALALLAAHFTLAVDHACVRTELEAEGVTAAALSAASAALTVALDDRPALLEHIVHTLRGLRDVTGVALLLYRPDGAPVVAGAQGEETWRTPPANPGAPDYALDPFPRAWLPLSVGHETLGALCLRWSANHAIREHERRLLSVFANGAAMALQHATLYEQARIQAERDPVTDLYNHRAFHNRLETVLEQARQSGEQAGVLLIDLVDFKLFNDTHGHQAGDQALRRVGEVLEACCRTSDAAARLGGDEFAVLLPNSDLESAQAVAERIDDLAAISALASPDGRHLPVRLSIGVAAYPADASSPGALLACADERMYEAKRSGLTISTLGRATPVANAVQGERFGILEALVAMVDNRDRYTGEHSEQVAAYACALGAELGLAQEALDTLRLAGLLHDVGKIGVPDRILRKPSKLSDEEFDIVRRHVELSEALVAVVSQNRDLMDAVRSHHERWDGTGYPRAAAGEDVPLLGRIMIVADAVSAMGMDRPYRKGLPWEHIAAELTRGCGVQFDPALVAPALRALQPIIAQAQAA